MSPLSALRYSSTALDIASANIANAQTEGYTRRVVDSVSVGAPGMAAMWSRYNSAVGGVEVVGIRRSTDLLLDSRVRHEHATQAFLDQRTAVLQRLESGIGEPGDDGIAAVLADLSAAWHDLANNPGGDAARSQVLAVAATLANAVQIQARNVATEASDQRSALLALVSEVNTVAEELAATNDHIVSALQSDTDANELLDRRDLLALRLSELVGAQGTVRPDGAIDIRVQGVSLVEGKNHGTMSIASGVTPTGAADGLPVSLEIDLGGTTTAVPSGGNGEVGAVVELLDSTLPAYATELSDVARLLADGMNTAHQAGYDLDGNPGTALFGYTPGDPAGTLTVLITDPRQVAASSTPGGNLGGDNALAMAGLKDAEGAYQRLVNDFGTEVSASQRLAATQALLTTQVDRSREQLAGVNLDEEMVAMVAAQRTYEAAARVMTVLDSVLDTLINRTGLLR
ncbi:MAG TPA: flagellar hook-associated protein FlgK [Nocardioides sp.]|nr:flagellar hook-associated protein FlgK [Nocardioides sp.]